MFKFFKKLIHTKPKVIVICGPTATGKTALSINIAQKFNGEIISADSRQIYKDLDIGSAKVTREEMNGITHHMIDVADPKEVFSVQQYVSVANSIIQDILRRKKTVIICGGTGMYIDSLVHGTQFPQVAPNPTLRSDLEKKSTDELFSLLKEKDPKRAETIDPYNSVRLIRALEVIDALGVVPKIKKKSKYHVLYIGLDTKKTLLNQRIKQRVINRFEKQKI